MAFSNRLFQEDADETGLIAVEIRTHVVQLVRGWLNGVHESRATRREQVSDWLFSINLPVLSKWSQLHGRHGWFEIRNARIGATETRDRVTCHHGDVLTDVRINRIVEQLRVSHWFDKLRIEIFGEFINVAKDAVLLAVVVDQTKVMIADFDLVVTELFFTVVVKQSIHTFGRHPEIEHLGRHLHLLTSQRLGVYQVSRCRRRQEDLLQVTVLDLESTHRLESLQVLEQTHGGRVKAGGGWIMKLTHQDVLRSDRVPSTELNSTGEELAFSELVLTTNDGFVVFVDFSERTLQRRSGLVVGFWGSFEPFTSYSVGQSDQAAIQWVDFVFFFTFVGTDHVVTITRRRDNDAFIDCHLANFVEELDVQLTAIAQAFIKNQLFVVVHKERKASLAFCRS